MRIQFSTATLFVVTGWIAIAIGGFLAAWRIETLNNSQLPTVARLLSALLFLSPWWAPLVFAAYCLGQQKVTARATLAFAAVECSAVGGMYWLVFG